jgi:hypothetical protein
MNARVLTVMVAGAAAAVACGASTTDTVSTGAGAQSSSASSSASSSVPVVAGGQGQLTFSGAVSGTISGNAECVVVLTNVHSITFRGQTPDGGIVTVTATDEQTGKAVITAAGKNYVFGGTGKLTVDAKSATFANVLLDAYGGSGSVTINGSVSCS